jgi:hypothetical protein
VPAVRALTDISGPGIDDDASRRVRAGIVHRACAQHANDAHRGIRAGQRCLGRCRFSYQLSGHRGPGRVGVNLLELNAVDARAETGFHEWADAHEAIAEDHGQVRDVATQPRAVLRRRDRESCHDDRGVNRVIVCGGRRNGVHSRIADEFVQPGERRAVAVEREHRTPWRIR